MFLALEHLKLFQPINEQCSLTAERGRDRSNSHYLALTEHLQGMCSKVIEKKEEEGRKEEEKEEKQRQEGFFSN